MAETTPMMVQYKALKERFRDTILFFRLGDFYEMFENDAREVSALLDLTLTRRAGVPMCGVPYHAASGYVARLLSAGKKVAVCEQSPVSSGRGLMARDVVEVVTPGTALDENYLPRNTNNYLMALGRVGDRISLAYADLSTSEFAATSFGFDEREEKLKKELSRLEPKEIITQESLYSGDRTMRALLDEREGCLINRYPDWSFSMESCRERLLKQFGVLNLAGFGLKDDSAETAAAGVILDYLADASKKALDHIASLSVYTDSSFMGMDEAAQKSLELVQNQKDGSRRYSLLEVLDQTRTSPGARKLRRRILTPLTDPSAIRLRLSAVDHFYRDQVTLSRLRDILSRAPDLERLASRLALERASAKDLQSIAAALESALAAEELLAGRPDIQGLTAAIRENRDKILKLADLINRAIIDEPAVPITEGNLIRRGFDKDLDRLHDLADNSRSILESYSAEEREKTGISSLKLKYNRIIGYYFEVTKSNLGHVPSHFIRRQSMLGAERFTTDRLAGLESEINEASEKIAETEKNLFLQVRSEAGRDVSLLQAVAEAVSELDVFQSLAFAATVRGYVKPRIVEGTGLRIREGRHPVVEAHLPGGAFVPNDMDLADGRESFVILTGPNMAGKSTYLRQTALIVLMAQMGSFVPAAEAEIGVVDGIFCRVGATDNLARGESTFLVEMNETAHILRAATRRSLLIMDEIGRGTSTRDGLSIAWAVCRYIIDRIGARTLFATHFHELTAFPKEGIINMSMDVLEKDGEVVFLKRVRPGPSDNSYGLHVAKLAGLPAEALEDAERMLSGLDGANLLAAPAPMESAGLKPRSAETQPLLFPAHDIILEEIKKFPLEKSSPLDALNRIAQWKEELESERDP